MDADLTFKAISYGLLGLLLVTALILSLVSIRKQSHYDEPLHGLFLVTLIVIGLCAFIAICSVYRGARSLQKISHRTEKVTVKGELQP